MRHAPYRNYLRRLAGAVSLFLLAAAAFNMLIDPYGLWCVASLRGVNWSKPEQLDDDMIFKAVDVIRRHPAGLLLGSSRAAVGLDPDDMADLDPSARPVYNLGLLGANLHAIRRYYEHALYNASELKQVVLSLDFFAFGDNAGLPPTYRDRRLMRKSIDWSDVNTSLLSLDATFASFRTLRSNIRDPAFQTFRADGMLAEDSLRRAIDRGGLVRHFNESIVFYLNSPERFANFRISEQAFADLAAIIHLSRDRGIDLKVFLPPEHASLLASMALRGHWCDFADWKVRIAGLTPFWDFSGFNDVTTEPISESMHNYLDASHFRGVVGRRILDRLFAAGDRTGAGDFGYYVTTANVESWNRHLARERAEWTRRNGPLIEWITAQMSGPSADAACNVAVGDGLGDE